jgi:hypothetical protein
LFKEEQLHMFNKEEQLQEQLQWCATQKPDKVIAQYGLRLPSMICLYFVQGLRQSLRQLCATNVDGKAPSPASTLQSSCTSSGLRRYVRGTENNSTIQSFPLPPSANGRNWILAHSLLQPPMPVHQLLLFMHVLTGVLLLLPSHLHVAVAVVGGVDCCSGPFCGKSALVALLMMGAGGMARVTRDSAACPDNNECKGYRHWGDDCPSKKHRQMWAAAGRCVHTPGGYMNSTSGTCPACVCDEGESIDAPNNGCGKHVDVVGG